MGGGDGPGGGQPLHPLPVPDGHTDRSHRLTTSNRDKTGFNFKEVHVEGNLKKNIFLHIPLDKVLHDQNALKLHLPLAKALPPDLTILPSNLAHFLICSFRLNEPT